ncbi:hypothetical protein [Bdellovibrio bacteriovorus]|uniref:hypothetical protein n=1 Tax=Bdellovibrio TaxID=958 RepID=UPI0035A83AEB
MNLVAKTLKEIRLRMQYESAKTFFGFLSERGLDCNYPYYMKIEKGDAFPSSSILNQIAKSLPESDGVLLVKAFCADQFKDFSYLFEVDQGASSVISEESIEIHQGQRELSRRQVHILASGSSPYHVFLMCTLARRPLQVQELETFFPKKVLSSALEVLIKEKIVVQSAQGIQAFSPDVIFPKDTSEELGKYYEKLDQWDIEFGEQFDLQDVLSKMLIRRISFRYLSLIQKQLEMLFDLVRSSDEIDTRHNSQIIQLQVSLKKGALPG